ncbi:hypothetical protein DCAR_0625728 [Daucus carota subsp. sativus]|uniref:Anaphase-promoting complex subunit 4 WD40 domain-containing protein n=1 Tax=Daucus carota subsp. sativus TaxID=79200 RepID=A0AAF0XDY7_DAUCS|nr:hypothetical protein DCAR_0625728 [Daucus carota subsp. sativus]
MPSFPHPESVTICEINRDLITADSLSDDQAKEAYGKSLGITFTPIPFQSDYLVNTDDDTGVQTKTVLQSILSGSLESLLRPNTVKLLPEVDFHGISWHQHKRIIAFTSGPNQVTVCDYDDSGKETCILISESQRSVKALEWRPNGGRTLSVACKGGICIWSASFPGNAAPVRSGVTAGTISGSSGIRWTLVDILRGHADEQVTALSWRLGTPIRRGLGGISILKWSPTGDYFFAAKLDGTFYLWETSTWASELWSSTSGLVTGASWDPDGHMVLIAFSESSTLGSIHFASKPPSLDAHLLPIELQEIQSLTLSRGVEKIAWDASGERLALTYKVGEKLYEGLIAIYDVRRTPLISASLVGFIRGPGENVKPVALSFHDKFKQGALLSVCWSSGYCCTYPLIFH